MSVEVIMPSLVTLFTLLVIGYVCGKLNLAGTEFTSQLSTVLVKVIMPIKIFCAIVQPFEMSMLVNCVIIFVLQLLFYVLSHLLAIGVTKLLKVPNKSLGDWLYALTFPNAGFMAFPILTALLGADGLFYGSIANIAFNLYSFTAGIYMFQKEGGEPISLKSICLTPVNIAIALGLVFFVCSIPIPSLFEEALVSFGDMTTPISMFILGAILSKTPLKNAFTSRSAYIINAFRLIFIPLIFGFIIILLPIEELLKQVLIIILAMPCATLTVIFSEKYGGDTELSATTVFLSNVLCMITLPLLLVWFF